MPIQNIKYELHKINPDPLKYSGPLHEDEGGPVEGLGFALLVILSFASLYAVYFSFLSFKSLLSEVDALTASQYQSARLNSVPRLPATKKTIPSEDPGTVREVSAYNAGDPAQTDDEPCIAANGEDICKALARGEKHCAANFVKLNSYLDVKGYGRCKVSDRLARRYTDTVDVAFQAHEKQRALEFGRQKVVVVIVK